MRLEKPEDFSTLFSQSEGRKKGSLTLVHQKFYVTSMYKLELVYDTNIK